MQESRLFQRFRALGLVTQDVPMVYSPRGKENFLTVSIGKAFQVYNCEKLTPAIVSPQLPKRIRALEAKQGMTFTACGADIIVWKRIVQQGVLKGHSEPIRQLLVLGNVLLSISEDKTVRLWNIECLEEICKLDLPKHFEPLSMMHPPTYLNKILIAGADGSVLLWNIKTNKQVYEFKGWGSTVSVIEASPAVDVVAIGLRDGRLIVHNLTFDKTLMTFKQTDGSVTSLSFRTDAAKIPLLVSGTESGDLNVWNLRAKRLEWNLPLAHDGRVSSVIFLPNQPVMVSSGADNSVKMWIFDQPDGSARLLKSREGHKAPPTRIRFYGGNTLATMADGADGMSCQLLSAGQDRAFRVFHTAREQMSRELSQGPLLKRAKKLNICIDDLKLSPVVQFASMETRAKDWCNVVTCHENDPNAYVWQFDRRAIGKHVLRQYDPTQPAPKGSEQERLRVQGRATSVTLSTCGNFALVGTAGGAIFKYNMQSGEKRGSFPSAASAQTKLIRALTIKGLNSQVKQDTSASDAHSAAVYGVVVDALNRTLISGSLDGTLKFWDFVSHQLVHTINVGATISQLELHRDSNLLLVVCDDHVLRVYDVTTQRLVRRFSGHSHRITDVAFSNDARWIFSCSGDNSIRVWDLPTGRCVDWLSFAKAPTGITISATGEFIATTHVGSVGIFLWANKAFFSNVYLDREPTDAVEMSMPVAVPEGQSDEIRTESSKDSTSEQQEQNYEQGNCFKSSAEKKIGGESSAIVLSTAPRALWETLFNLELIKQRNKPLEPPKAPEKAPFFLPTIHKDGEMDPVFTDEPLAQNGEWEDDEGGDEDQVDGNSRLLNNTNFSDQPHCELAKRLIAATQVLEPTDGPASFHSVSEYLFSLSASAVDVELSSLCLGDFDEAGLKSLSLFLIYITQELESRRSFQVVQAYLNRFLKLHGDLIADSPALLQQIEIVFQVQREGWKHLQELLHNNLCMVRYFSKIQM